MLLLASAGFVLAKKDEGPKPVPWSFGPLKRGALPKVKDTAWPKTRIDYFIFAKMEAAGMRPASRAEEPTPQRGRSMRRRFSRGMKCCLWIESDWPKKRKEGKRSGTGEPFLFLFLSLFRPTFMS
jgi:hypothetical protein